MKLQVARMPDKPLWFDRLAEAVQQLEALPSPWVDRATLEFILGIGRRRAQQILAPLVRKTIGKSGLALREEVIEHLQQLAAGEAAYFARQRRERMRSLLEAWQRQARERPRLLVQAPTAIVNQELDNLPPGVHVAPGRILIEGFRTPEEAHQKLLALAMAMANDPTGFEARIAAPSK
jgi:hypothetical protein